MVEVFIKIDVDVTVENIVIVGDITETPPSAQDANRLRIIITGFLLVLINVHSLMIFIEIDSRGDRPHRIRELIDIEIHLWWYLDSHRKLLT